MRSYLFLPSLLLTTVLCYLPTYGSTDAERVSAASTSGEVQVITISDSGLSPSTLKIRVGDSIVSFVNSTTDSPITLSLHTGDRTPYCASSNSFTKDRESGTSKTSLLPNDSASACLRVVGSYAYTISGLKNAPDGFQGIILVE